VPSIIIGDDHKISRIVMNYLGTLYHLYVIPPCLRWISLIIPSSIVVAFIILLMKDFRVLRLCLLDSLPILILVSILGNAVKFTSEGHIIVNVKMVPPTAAKTKPRVRIEGPPFCSAFLLPLLLLLLLFISLPFHHLFPDSLFSRLVELNFLCTITL